MSTQAASRRASLATSSGGEGHPAGGAHGVAKGGQAGARESFVVGRGIEPRPDRGERYGRLGEGRDPAAAGGGDDTAERVSMPGGLGGRWCRRVGIRNRSRVRRTKGSGLRRRRVFNELLGGEALHRGEFAAEERGKVVADQAHGFLVAGKGSGQYVEPGFAAVTAVEGDVDAGELVAGKPVVVERDGPERFGCHERARGAKRSVLPSRKKARIARGRSGRSCTDVGAQKKAAGKFPPPRF